MKISDIQIGKRHRIGASHIDELVASIEELGLLQPIVVTEDKHLVAGFRRLKAFEHLGRKDIPTVVAENLTEAVHLLKAERDENLCRVGFTPEEAVGMGEAIAETYKPIAVENQTVEAAKHGKKGGRPKETLGKTLPKGSEPKPRDESARTLSQAAAAVGMSRPTYEKAQAVIEAAKENPAFRPLVDEMNRTGKVSGAFKKLQRTVAAEQINAEPPPLPTGPFRVIVADPPWRYDARGDDPTHRAGNPYPSMTIAEIAAMPVEKLACDDAALWMWVTNSHLPEVWPIIESWGFTYKTMLTWAKDRMGTGDWLRGQTEHCLMCVRGKPTILLTNQTTLLHGPLREHSRKPDEFYAMVETMCPGSKVELFCREQREGWAVHGNEV